MTLEQHDAVNEFVRYLRENRRLGPQLVHHRELAAIPASYRRLALPHLLRRALAAQGIEQLYSHQVEAIARIRKGEDVLVATPTASGKSLIYTIPVLQRWLAEPQSRALFLFPLKALAQDQLRAINSLIRTLDIAEPPQAAIIDGDTSSYHRRKIRHRPPAILLSNPDMLHLSLLGYHDRWAGLWPQLNYIILDEVHSYRGIFGSHLAWVLRRLERICRLYGARPQFILSSATVGNPGDLAEKLLGRPVAVISQSGSPAGKRQFVFVDPVDSAAGTATELLAAAVERGLRTIVYTQSRKMAELISVWAAARMGKLRHKLSAYRAGYLPEERRRIEADLTQGRLLGVVSTSALELGIDIGALDLCLLVGYPGTLMAAWQRAGRVGRRQRQSLVVLIGQEDALDQYFLRHPEEFFSRPVEAAVLNPENPEIIGQHLICAAGEEPLTPDDALLAGEHVQRVARELVAAGRLLEGANEERLFAGRAYPHRLVGLRGAGRNFAIYDDENRQRLGEIDGFRCFRECHPGAVYLHRGQTWITVSLDIEGREVTAIRRKVNYFTRPLTDKQISILERSRQRRGANFTVAFGRLRVTDRVVGFQRRSVRGGQLIASEPLDLPPHIIETEGLWIEIPAAVRETMAAAEQHFMGGIHAIEHAAIGVFPLLVLCDRNDIGGISQPDHPQLDRAAVFIYDGHSGGVGLCREVFEHIDRLLEKTREVIDSCPCETGCPSCVHSPKCGSGNRPIDKEAAAAILHALLTAPGSGKRRPKMPPACDAIPAPPPAAAGVGKVPEQLLHRLRYGVFDLETKRSAAEVGGWHLAERMGVSVGVLYDAEVDEFLVYEEEEIGQLVARLRQLELVVGFNNLRFDNRVLSAYTSFPLHTMPTLDLLAEIKKRLNYRLSLDALARHTLGVEKSADGLAALKWYREGRMDEIIAYCRQDVRITRDLFLYGCRHGHLVFQNKGGHRVRCPVRFDQRLREVVPGARAGR